MIKIIADSGCDFSQYMVQNAVCRVPLTLQLGEDIYTDSGGLDIDMYTNRLNAVPRGRKTAAPSPEMYFEAFKEGDAVFAVTLSQHLSGSYASAEAARNMYLEEIGEKPIYIIDSQSASAGQTLIVHKLLKLTQEGLSHKEISEIIYSLVPRVHTYFILESFNTIVDTGRMNGYVARLASMLNIVPICAGVEGKMALIAQARGRKKAYARLGDIMEKTGDDPRERDLFITHVAYPKEAESLAQYLNQRLPFRSTLILPPTGLVCTYADYHGLIIAF